MVGEQQVDEDATLLGDVVGLGDDDHALGDRRGAGDDRRLRALDLDQTEPTRGERLEPVVLAERGDVDAASSRRLDDRGIGLNGGLPSIDGDSHAFHRHLLRRVVPP